MKKNSSKSKIYIDAVSQSFKKLSPRIQTKNPVMFVVYIGAILTSALFILSFAGISDEKAGYTFAIAMILWFTVLFANFAEAIAEGRGRAQADTLRKSRRDVKTRKLKSEYSIDDYDEVLSNTLKKGDIVYVVAGEQIPMDGEVIDGAASVDESAITGESAPVIRESGGDRSAVTGGTTLVSDSLIIRVTSEPGGSFLDRMITMVEGASRKKTPTEIALQILLVTLTIIFLVVTATLLPFSDFAS
ncbi:MAG: potassium-transporting ATPase subunit B, partial [Bacillota bacterium]|nr:potassium-transporting ATPase subunit B [Bacillota bacterium]